MQAELFDAASAFMEGRDGVPLTLVDRVEAYRLVFGRRYPDSVPWIGCGGQRETLYAVWLPGRDYRVRSGFYGAYPKGYLPRVMALFPDVTTGYGHRGPGWLPTLHVFSGSLPAGHYLRCDVNQEAELRCSVYDLPDRCGVDFDLILADPPYSRAHARRYGTPMVDRRRAMAALASVARPGAHCVWLDLCWPMHRKMEWETVGFIYLQRSTNHATRVASVFRRTARPALGINRLIGKGKAA